MGIRTYVLLVLELIIRIFLDILLLFTSPIWYCLRTNRKTVKKNFQCILITGATSGIGEGLALGYAASGVRLVLTGRNKQRLEKVASDCRAKGAEVKPLLLDVTNEEKMSTQLLRADDEVPFDLIIANAATHSQALGIPDIPSRVKTLFQTNVDGVFHTVFPLLPRLRQRKRGQIAVVASLASFYARVLFPDYAATKVAIRYVFEAMRPLLAKENIGVSIVCPGFVRSAMAKGAEKFPFFMETEPACKIIRERIAKNEAIIAFPFPLYMTSVLLGNLPALMRDVFRSKMMAGGDTALAQLGQLKEESK